MGDDEHGRVMSRYFVSYAAFRDGKWAFGNSDVAIDGPVCGIEEIGQIERKLVEWLASKNVPADQVIVLHWRLFQDPEYNREIRP